ncbi:MAG: DUF4956 domain-containing protein [Paludibacteraceae bacterium]|nr:DUF4956 domain-containing protein [Paludibacteraceae bacterium]
MKTIQKFLLLASVLLMTACGNVSEQIVSVDDDPSYNAEIAHQYGTSAQQSNTVKLFEVPLYDSESTPADLMQLFVRFAFNLLMCWIIVYFFYYRKSRRHDYMATFLIFNTTMFLLICLMKNVNMQIGLTLGLFAIFGMIRYRTETVPIREMTYLFVITGLAVINGLSMVVSFVELVFANALFIAVIATIEYVKVGKTKATKLVLYDRIELIVPEKRAELVADLEKRLGFKIDDLEIGHVDFLRDVAFIKVIFTLDKGATETIGSLVKAKDFVQ